MKRRSAILILGTCFVSLTVCFAADNPMLGTWKLNDAKSKIAAGVAKNNTVVYEADGDNIKCTIEGIDGQGNPTHIQWAGKFDGKDYPLTGDPGGDTRAYKKISQRTLEGITKKNGKVSSTSRIVIATDGKSRTVTTDLTDVGGKKAHNVWFYDKQ